MFDTDTNEHCSQHMQCNYLLPAHIGFWAIPGVPRASRFLWFLDTLRDFFSWIYAYLKRMRLGRSVDLLNGETSFKYYSLQCASCTLIIGCLEGITPLNKQPFFRLESNFEISPSNFQIWTGWRNDRQQKNLEKKFILLPKLNLMITRLIMIL